MTTASATACNVSQGFPVTISQVRMGVASANLSRILRKFSPEWSIKIFAVSDFASQSSSNVLAVSNWTVMTAVPLERKNLDLRAHNIVSSYAMFDNFYGKVRDRK